MNNFSRPSMESVKDLTAEAHLLASDLTIKQLLGAPETLGGVVGLKIYGQMALLRSLAVMPEHWGCGYGKALVDKAEEYASSKPFRRSLFADNYA